MIHRGCGPAELTPFCSVGKTTNKDRMATDRPRYEFRGSGAI
jgi:hypothetical protein